MNRLTLRYRYDASFRDPRLARDDFGRLSVAVETECFAARGGFWVQWQDVRGFGDALDVFPIADGQTIAAQWGFEEQAGDDLILRIAIAPADRRGTLDVRFEIADDAEPSSRARGRFQTTCSDVAAFRAAVARLMDGEVEEAVSRPPVPTWPPSAPPSRA